MDRRALLLSRLQLAFTVSFHILPEKDVRFIVIEQLCLIRPLSLNRLGGAISDQFRGERRLAVILPSAQRNSILFFGMIAGAWTTERRQIRSGSKVGDRRLDQIRAIDPSAASRTPDKMVGLSFGGSSSRLPRYLPRGRTRRFKELLRA